MDKADLGWCRERLAIARNELQILFGGHRHFIDKEDVTDAVRIRALRDIAALERIVAHTSL